MRNKKAFTLVELIVVVTILAILSTIGFVSYSGYLAGVRDTNRIAQLKAIGDALDLYSTNKSLPVPDDKIDIKTGTKIISYQGISGKDVIETIGYTSEGLDPKDKIHFSYYLTKNKKAFQLMAFLEEEYSSLVQIKKTLKGNAEVDYSTRYPYVIGNKLGILTNYINIPIEQIGSLITAAELDISDVGVEKYKAHLKYDEVLEGTGTTFSDLDVIATDKGKGWSVELGGLTYVDLDKEGWMKYDSNCDNGDIVIGTQVWAGCNSTLGGIGKSYNGTCSNSYGGVRNDLYCTGGDNRENLFAGSTVKSANNIWGKNYAWEDLTLNCIGGDFTGPLTSECPCKSGRHIPTNLEIETLTNLLITNKGDSNIGWSNHELGNSTNNFYEALNMPIGGTVFSSGNGSERGFRMYMTSASHNGSYVYIVSSASHDAGIDTQGYSSSVDEAFSVRCIED